MNLNYLLLFLVFLTTNLSAQNIIEGTITDIKGEPLAFVNILINGSPNDGSTSDIDGKFRLENTKEVDFLLFSYVGYESLKFPLNNQKKNLRIQLKATAFTLQGAEVVAGENPAHRIIRKVLKNRDQNNPEKLDFFRCKTYNKMTFGFLPDEEGFEDYRAQKEKRSKMIERRDSNLMNAMATSKKQYFLIMESVTDRKFRAPNHNYEQVIHNKVSGFKAPNFVALANAVQPFSFYQNEFIILDKTFLNPISPGSTNKYFFNIEDTLYQKRDTVFILSFQPKKGKNFEGLQGMLYINSNRYAIQNVIAEPFDKSFINMKIEQKYSFIKETHWFPEQLNFEMEATSYPHKYLPIQIVGKSYIDEIDLNTPIEKKEFGKLNHDISEQAHLTTDSLWAIHRHEDLDDKDKRTYEVLDSLGEKKNFDRTFNLLEALANGQLAVGKFDLPLTRLVALNDFEKVRVGMGLYTNKKLSKHFRLGGYTGYGFRDKAWKYGGDLTLFLWPQKELELQFRYQKDLHLAANTSFLSLDQIVNQQFYAERLDNMEEYAIHLKSTPIDYTQINIEFRKQDLQNNYDYQFIPTPDASGLSTFKFTELNVSLRFAYGEKYVPFFGSNLPEPSNYPVLQIGYTKGFNDLLEGQFNYSKWLVGVEQTFRWHHLGRTHFRIEGGFLQGDDLPFPKLFSNISIGTGGGLQVFGDIFQTMNPYEFISDRYVNFFFNHNFGTRLFKTKKFKPEISIAHNMGFGDLKAARKIQHRGNCFTLNTMEKGFYESGLRIDNILRFSYFNVAYIGLGVSTYYRYGPYAFPEPKDNFAYRLTLNFIL